MRTETNLETGEVTNLEDAPLPVYTQAELDAKAEYDSLEYARSRKDKYDLLNQFEMQFDDAANGTTTWIDAINAIKQEFPK